MHYFNKIVKGNCHEKIILLFVILTDIILLL
jgi:hypothetical protein